jgi:hypothetical protein
MTKDSFLPGVAAIVTASILYGCGGSHALPLAGALANDSLASPYASITDGARGKGGSLKNLPPQAATVVVHPSQVGPAVTRMAMGALAPAWYNLTLPGISEAIAAANFGLTRFPGGAQVDIYNWQTGQDGPKGTPCAGNANSESTIDTFMKDVALPAGTQVSLGVNYGSNAQCTGGNTPANAAAFVSHVIKNYGSSVVAYWELGNEQYAPGATNCFDPDCRNSRNPDEFAKNEASFYDAMHAAGAKNVCIPVDAANPKSPWNPVVFLKAKYDCANIVYYPQRIETSDSFLLYQAIPELKTQIAAVQAQLVAAHRANTPILLSAISSALGPYGKQSQSIVSALYADMAMGEALNDGVAAMIWHAGFGSCDSRSQGGDFASSVFGWQDYGGAMIFSDGHSNVCPVTAQRGTLLATANAFLAGSMFVDAGGNMVSVTVSGNPNVRAYASSKELMLFNLSKSAGATVTVSVDGAGGGAGGASVYYGRGLYDKSKWNVWAAPVYATLPAWKGSMHLSLRRWSVTVVPVT